MPLPPATAAVRQDTPTSGSPPTTAPGSIRELHTVSAEVHAAWVRGAALTAIIAYGAIPLVGLATEGVRYPQVLTEIGACLAAIVALWLERRGRAMAGGMLLAFAFVGELHASLLVDGGFPLEVVLALPLAVAALGLLLGGRAAIVAGLVISLSAPATASLGALLRGSPRWPPAPLFVLAVLAAILVAAGVLVHLGLGAFRRAARVALESQQRAVQLGRIVEDTGTEVYVVDRDTGRFAIVSRGARDNLGYGADELARLTWAQVSSAWRQGPAAAGPPAITSGPAVHRRRDGGAYPVEVQVHRAELQGRAVDVVFATDISARIGAEKERERLQLQLQHAQKMEAVGLLAGGVAHDFNNLLMAIGGFAELLCDHADAEVREIADEIVRAQARGASLTRQLLSFARKEVVQPRLCEPGHLVGELASLLKRLAGETVDLVVHARPCRPLWIDRGQFEQTVINLVSNARDAVPDHGRIEVLVEDVEAEAGAPPRVRLRVSDNGHGMDEATRARIFEPFFTTKARHKGTGLGLAVVLGIVSQNGGRIDVDSSPGRGTTVTVLWPAAAADLVAEQDATPRGALAGGTSPTGTILVADDDDGARAFVRRVLERAGHTVVDAADATRALEAALARGVRVDVLLTDVVMPDMSGFELAERFRARFPDTPVLFMSGYIDERALAPATGGVRPDVVSKPLKTADLLALVGEACARRAAGGAQAAPEAATG